MELLHVLLLTAFIAIFLSFLIAKLVAMAMAGADCSPGSQVSATRNVDPVVDGNTTEDLQYGERLQIRNFESEKRVEFVATESQFVDQFLLGSGEAEEIDKSISSDEVIEAECCELPTNPLEEISKRDNKLSDVDEFQVNREFGVNFSKDQRTIKQQSEEVSDDKEIGADDSLIEENVKIAADLSVAKCISEEYEEIQADRSEAQELTDEKKIGIDSDDDEWEGIERSELEIIFAKATKFMENEDLTSSGSDLQLELYGLHKVVTEGPCRQQAPMPLKVGARAKWNAWQRLGNMTPEVAMEQYVALVSDNIPGWKQDKFSGDGKTEALEVATIGVVAADYAELSKIAEDIPSTEKDDLSGGPILESLAKE